MKLSTGAAVLAACLLTAAGVGAAEGWFTDVPDDHRRAAAIRYARAEGMFQGFPDGRFAPDEELSEGQFIEVAERLYDRYDVWTRAEWAQVLYAGVPGLTAGPGGRAPAGTDRETASETAPAVDAALCGWPLGEAEPVLPLPSSSEFQFRFPITPCAPPVTYRIEFVGQALELAYPSDPSEQVYTPTLTWALAGHVVSKPLKVTELRPGGPAEGKVLGRVELPGRVVRERTPSTPPAAVPNG